MKTRLKLQVTGQESQGLGPLGQGIKTEMKRKKRRRRRKRKRSKSLGDRPPGLEVAAEAGRHVDITHNSRASAEAGPARQKTTSGTQSESKPQEGGHRPSSLRGRSQVTAQETGSPQRTHQRVRPSKVKAIFSHLQPKSQRSRTQRTNQKLSSRSSTGSSGLT